ncbi:MAG: UDP-N-acetylglucosamine 2-epimerase [Methylococcaceae bacterium]|jgi:GDP/UDP-N,N'-diacetylbacillosamine 2-epimerase (hydrolysing)
MHQKRKLCVVTGSRAEYGLLYWLMREITDDPDLTLQLVVTGMHLSPEFGLTWQQIQQDGFIINRKVEMLLSSDTGVGIAKSLGLGIIGFADALDELKPDVVVILGDRYEVFAAAQAAMALRIPIAHIHGGELTEGAIDEAIRHALTKMAHLHFTATEAYRKRVIQLGEQPQNVFNVGASGLDHMSKTELLGRGQLEEALGFKLGKRNLLVTFHPVTLEQSTAADQFEQLLNALSQLDETVHILFTLPNADTDGRSLINRVTAYQKQHAERVVVFKSLGSLRYLSALQFVDAVVGNSSSGLIEAPAFKIASVNIGDRQKGRLCAASVINCVPEQTAILQAINQAFSDSFRQLLPSVENPYGSGNTSLKIKNILKHCSLAKLLKKPFYDLAIKDNG